MQTSQETDHNVRHVVLRVGVLHDRAVRVHNLAHTETQEVERGGVLSSGMLSHSEPYFTSHSGAPHGHAAKQASIHCYGCTGSRQAKPGTNRAAGFMKADSEPHPTNGKEQSSHLVQGSEELARQAHRVAHERLEKARPGHDGCSAQRRQNALFGRESG